MQGSEDKNSMDDNDMDQMRVSSQGIVLPLFHDIYRLSTTRWHSSHHLHYQMNYDTE